MANVVICAGISFPSTHMRPVGPFQLANVLRQAGFTVQVIDCWPWIAAKGLETAKQVLEHFVNEDTLWVGFSSTWLSKLNQHKKNLHAVYNDLEMFVENTYIFNSEELLELKNHLKAKSPNCKFVMGGGRAPLGRTNAVPPFIDCFIEGYADTTVLEWTRYCQGKNPFLPTHKNTDGSISLTHDHKASRFDYNNHKFTWHDNDMVQYGEALPMEIARGCIFNCAFCAYPLNGRKKLDYLKDPIILRQQLQENYDRFGTTHYWFLDDTFNDSLEKLEILYNSVFAKLPFKVNFSAFLRLDLINAHPISIDLLRDMGCRGLSFGIESLNYESVKAIGKGITKDKVYNTLMQIKEKIPDGIVDSQFIVGLPNETAESAESWLREITDQKYPIDAIKIHSLSMNFFPKVDNIWQSHFEKNPEKYGYTFRYNKRFWVNNMNFSKRDADAVIAKCQDVIDKKGNFGWLGQHGIKNMGVDAATAEDFLKLDVSGKEQQGIKIRNNFVNRYIQDLLKLNPQ